MHPIPLIARVLAGAAASVAVLLASAGASAQGVPRGAQTMPTVAYDAALAALGAGDYAQALETAGREYAGGVRAGNQRWLDSVAAATLVGEAHFELGTLREAVAAYDEAILLGATHAEWLLSVQFPTQGPQSSARPRVATWGRSTRGTRTAVLPDTMAIRQSGDDPQKVLQQGGVLAAPVNVPIRPQEIIRSLVIAIYRRGMILGPLASEGTAIDEINTALSKRPAPPNHWSQSWIDVALGVAAWSQGRADQAVPLLERGLAFGGKLDHHLTPWGLIVLGRIALARDDAVSAVKLFEEATFSAAEFGDSRALEEAFRGVVSAHALVGTPGVPASVQGGGEWARNTLPVLRGLLLAHAAELLAASGNPQGATARLAEIDPRLRKGGAGQGGVGAIVAHAAALTAYASGDTAAGDAELELALGLARPRTPRLFQTGRLVEMVMAGTTTISDRQADILFARLLGDPPPREFVADPLATLATVTTPRTEAHDAWELVAARRGTDAALAAAESALRARWLDTQPSGGRRVGLERLLGADPQHAAADVVAARAALLKRHPEVARQIDEDSRLRTGLTAAMLGAAGRPAGAEDARARSGPPGEPRDWEAFAAVSARRGAAIDLLAASRESFPVDFPPLLPPPDVRARLAPGELILSFRWTAAGLWGALESRERVATWQVRQPGALVRELGLLAKSLCLFDPHAPVPVDRIAASDWRASAATVERLLFEQSKVSLAEGVEELAIVPDGALWYLPFDILPVGTAAPDGDVGVGDGAGDGPPLLRDVCRIRYAPTRSLAVAGGPAPPPDAPAARGPVGIHAGRPVRGERPELQAESVERIAAALDRAVPLPAQAPPSLGAAYSAALPAAVCETLVVLDEVNVAGEGAGGLRGLFGRAGERGPRRGGLINDWLASPHKRPQRVVVPGMQSAMASGLARPPARPGEELFVAAVDLLAAGARTAVVSRWRMGGKSSTDLMTEFLRDTDQPGVGAAASWRRAVDVVRSEEPDPAHEGRIRPHGQVVLADMRHPLFWAGYLLVDGGTHQPPPAVVPPGPGRPAGAAAKKREAQ